MNPSVAVAFMTKMKLIFETDANGNPQDDTFLAFQNGSFPVSKDTFYFMEPAKHGLGPTDTLTWMMNFDKTFNFVATVDDVITSTPDELDQVYYETLKNCVPATSNRTPEQEARYAAALAFLQRTVPGPDGQSLLMLDNSQLYESAYKEATTAYKNSKIAADSAQGDGADQIKKLWQETEPQLKHACDQALLDWETKGHKTEVEANLGVFITLSGSSPVKTVADLKNDYELFSKPTSLNENIEFLPTQFTPINFYEDTVPWQSLSLDKSEINSLLAKAPQHLKNIFELEANTDIESLTVEFAVVEILRDWLHVPDFLLQRFWKLAPGATPLADGKGGGRLPAFPAKLLFVRNVKMVTRRNLMSAPAPQEPFRLTAQLFAKTQATVQQQLQTKATTFQVRDHRTQLQLTTFRAQQAKAAAPVAPRPLLTQRIGMVQPSLLMAKTVGPAASIGPLGPVVKPTPLPRPGTPVRVVTQFPKTLPLPSRVIATPKVVVVKPSTPPAPVLETTVQKEMELLAFICRKLPVCPNPDPTLPWG